MHALGGDLAVDSEASLAARAAWLSYVGGFTQEAIAERLSVSRMKANRLIALAQRRGMIRVFIEGVPAECVSLEDQLVRRYGLRFCTVVPEFGPLELPLHALGVAGARFLHDTIEKGSARLIGVGHGRTLASAVEHLPRLTRERLQFVSLLGSLTRHAAANPFDVVYRLVERTGAESYFMPVPFFADSVEAKQVLMAQQSLRDVFELARRAELSVVGIGQIAAGAHLLEAGMITEAELEDARLHGAVGEVLGQFLNEHGEPVAADVNARAIGLKIDDLRGREVVAIAGGSGKARAIDAVLKSKVITGLITDEATARRLAQRGGASASRALNTAHHNMDQGA
jgi:DNA-binding transcriptional regulator LsrR (DeoR family)